MHVKSSVLDNKYFCFNLCHLKADLTNYFVYFLTLNTYTCFSFRLSLSKLHFSESSVQSEPY